MLLVNAHQIEKSFAGRTLFKQVSFGIEEKERIGLVGPNGSGKSTLIKILAQQMAADAGKVAYKRGLRLGFLDQTPQFESEETILSAILSKCADKDDSLGPAYEWMARLELTDFGQDFLVRELSGGWKKRVALARELILEPELLLLDEPTNHLDISSILWLEEYLQSASFSFLVVTHDRLFLQRVVNKIFDLDPKNPNFLLSITGSYLDYLEAKDQILATQNKLEQVLKNTLRRETEWLRRGAKARQTKQKARIENALALNEEVKNLQRTNTTRKVDIDFSDSEKNPKKLIDAKNISKHYGDKKLFENLNLLITPKTRLALLGNNGCGKSTLIRILLGLEAADQGQIQRADGLKYTYFEQNRETLKPKLSVLKNICPEGDYVCYRGQNIYARSYLDRFLFSSQMADQPVERLSGGEQARLRIAQLMLNESQVLILDEPTNDLDVQTLAILENALHEFSGAVILVTHDRYFMDAVSSEILAFPINYSAENSAPVGLQRFASYLQYEEWTELQKLQKQISIQSTNSTKNKVRPKITFKEKFELDHMEESIQILEERMTTLQSEIEMPEVTSKASRLMELSQEISNLQTEIDRLYKRWSELEEKTKE